jgi:cell division protein FtsL
MLVLRHLKTKNKKVLQMTNYQMNSARNNYAWRQNKTLASDTRSLQKIGNVSRGILAVMIVLFFGLFYVSQATRAGALAGPISEMQAKVESLKRENQGLSVEVAKMQSLNEVKKSEVAATLGTPTEVGFIQ